jgi:hypothetical protein
MQHIKENDIKMNLQNAWLKYGDEQPQHHRFFWRGASSTIVGQRSLRMAHLCKKYHMGQL